VSHVTSSLSLRTLTRAVLTLFVVAALLPAVASAQDPATGGYSGTGPTEVTGTAPPPASGTKNEEVASPGAPADDAGAAAPATDTLPFTGLQIAAMIAAGLGLLGLGMALRRLSGPAMPGT